MVVLTPLKNIRTKSRIEPYPFTTRQFAKMIDAGVFPPDIRVELIEGVIVEKMTRNPPHIFAVDGIEDLLRGLDLPGWIIRKESPVSLARDWQPEPDLSIVIGPRDRYRKSHPSSADVAILVEVSESTYMDDRRTKWHGYAAARIPVYWIVNLSNRVVEVYSNPSGRGKTAKYRESSTFGPGEFVPVMIEGREVGKVAVDVFMP